MSDDLLPLEERRAVYQAWRSQLNERAQRNRDLIDLRDEPAPVSDEWSPERLFEESRRHAEVDQLL